MAKTKYLTEERAKSLGIDLSVYPSAGPNPNITGMKKLYWGNDASSIVSVCGTANADETVYSALSNAAIGATVMYSFGLDASNKPKQLAVSEATIIKSGNNVNALADALTTYLPTVLPDGFPAAQTGRAFTLTFTVTGTDDAKSLSITCTQGGESLQPHDA